MLGKQPIVLRCASQSLCTTGNKDFVIKCADSGNIEVYYMFGMVRGHFTYTALSYFIIKMLLTIFPYYIFHGLLCSKSTGLQTHILYSFSDVVLDFRVTEYNRCLHSQIYLSIGVLTS